MENNIFAEIYPLSYVGLVSLLASVSIVSTKRFHLNWTSRGHARSALQSAHTHPTPRVGGIAFALGLVVALLLEVGEGLPLLLMILVSAIPVYVAGLLEDVSIPVRPRTRLLAAILSSLIMALWSGYWIARTQVPMLDSVLSFVPAGILFTLLVTSGTAHAFNLVDGLNGLSTGIGAISAVCLSIMAITVHDHDVAVVTGTIFFAVGGVFLINYPKGRVFLGDAGAYLLGFTLAWSGVLLIARNPSVSPWAVFLVLFWSIMDMLFAILRRLARRVSMGKPDRMHFHHLVYRVVLNRQQSSQNSSARANPVATAIMFPLFVTPGILGVLSVQNQHISIALVLLCTTLFALCRLGIVRRFRQICRLDVPMFGLRK